MALVVVAKFCSLQEAQVAASALRAGGLHAVVCEEFFGGMVWTEQVALQGFRLMVLAEEREDAVGFFRSLPQYRPRRLTRKPAAAVADGLWRVLTVIVWFFLPPFGWMMVGALRRGRKGRLSEMAMGGLISLGGSVAGSAVALLLAAVLNGITTGGNNRYG
jgi:hypothetical protein